jgi:uncharacterized repeat protein (TIGR02543 family)
MKKMKTLLLTCILTLFAWQSFAQKPVITSIEIAGRGVASQTSFNDSDPLQSLGDGIFVWEGNLNYVNPNATSGSQGFKFVVNAHLETGVDTDWNPKWCFMSVNSSDEEVSEGNTYAVRYQQGTANDWKWRLKQNEDGFYRITIDASDIDNITMTLDKDPGLLYKGNSLPTAQGWTEHKLDNTINPIAAPTTATVENDVLKLTSTNTANQFSQLGWYQTGVDFKLATGFVLEIKAKVISADKTGAFNIQGKDKTGKGFRIGILADKITELTNPFAATKVLASDLTNGDDFHIFKFAVAPSGVAAVYRDGTLLGTFLLSIFDFDNYIENGGFEDEAFPDFTSNGILRRISKSEDPHKVQIGDYSLEMDNNGLVTNGWTNIENARTRDIAVKPNTQYELRINRRRSASEPWCWRDGGAFYNGQLGTLAGVDDRGNNITWLGFERVWQTHPQDFTTPAMDADHQSVRLEFPTWTRDGDKNQNTTAFDNVVLREKPAFSVLPTYAAPVTFTLAPAIPDGITNLIINGDFEDHELNNDGTAYTWALSDPARQDGNDPYADNPLWNTGKVRIQRSSQNNDFESGNRDGLNYAHSGTSSLRFTTDWNNAGAREDKNFDFVKELEANKTYRFVFWTRSPKWPDNGWLFVRVGEGDPIWGHLLKGRNNVWTPVDLTFTTTEENKTLHLYSGQHGDWWNLYLDDLVLYEIPDGAPLDPQLEGKTNLIANGDFEDVTINNDGEHYNWALASQDESNDYDFPMAYNEMWGTWLRIQDKEKRGGDIWGDRDDTGYDWAHSGTRSVRFTYEDNWGAAQAFEGVSGDVLPAAYKLNLNFKKELEPNKTYTFVFWIKTSCWDDRGWFNIANGELKVMRQELDNRYMNWTRQSVTFSTTADNHTLRMFTEFGGWMNFYLDDLFLYEEGNYVPAAEPVGDTYLAFGKSTGTSSADVEIEYIKINNTGSGIYTAQFYANGGSETAVQVVAGDGTATVTEPADPEKEGYAFGGWYSDLALTTLYNFSTPVTKNVILYAKWNVAYRIIFNTNGGEEIAESTYTGDESVVLPVPVKTGYTFLGWYDNSEFTGDAVTEIPQGSAGDKTFYAKWYTGTGLDTVNVPVLNIYPNPVGNGILTVGNMQSLQGQIEIYSILGTLVKVYNITGATTRVDVSALPAGTYLVKADGKKALLLKK